MFDTRLPIGCRSPDIQCHNTHPESPKKDWKVGDVRGILEISMPVKQAESGADMILFSTIAILIGLGTIFIVNNTRNKENESMILELNANLEQKVETRTIELAKSNEDLTNAIANLEKINAKSSRHSASTRTFRKISRLRTVSRRNQSRIEHAARRDFLLL